MTSTSPVRVLYAGPDHERDAWIAAMTASMARRPGLAALTGQDDPDPDYVMITADGPIADLSAYRRAKAFFSLWAGVEALLARPDLPVETPLVRMVEDGLTHGMVDYVTAMVYRALVDLPGLRAADNAGRWANLSAPPLATDFEVGVLGAGVLGAACAASLVAAGFPVRGWSRSRKALEGVRCYAGWDELDTFLGDLDVLVVLAPQTPETIGLLSEPRLRRLKPGAHVVNAARGPLLPEAALLAALEDHLGGAALDVFDVEPLPEDHPYWRHSKILVTPHIASKTRSATGAESILQQIERHVAGADLEHVVDKSLGY